MKPYPRYKPTGLAWLPSVPEHWEVRKLRHILSPVSEKNHAEKPLLSVVREKGVILRDTENKEENHNFIPDDLSNYKLVREDQFAMNKMKAWQGSYGVSSYEGIVSPAYFVFDVHGVEKDFFHTAIRSAKYVAYFAQSSDGIRVGQWDLSIPRMKEIPFLIPPPSEQDRIVRYLDEKTAAIDELVRAKEREIDLLRERKQALVSAAVTGGLDPATERKDSGVPWIGKIPKGWNVLKLRQILSPVSEKNRPDLPLLSVVREKGVIIRDKDDMEENRNFIPDDLSGYKVVRKGQFAMNKMKAWQGSYGVSPYDGIVSPAYFVFNIRFDNPEYFHLAIRSKVYVDFFAQASDGIRIGQWDLNLAKMKEIPFLVPSAREQKEIVERMPVLFAETDRKIALAEKSIALLQELRTRLVSDAVTGAVEV